jgi:hypothetical protein
MINEFEFPTVRHRKQVAVLLVRHLFEALRQRRIEVADSEPHWLTPWQYRERGGGIELLPGNAGSLMGYAREQSFLPLGVVTVDEDGEYWEYFNDDPFSAQDREFALKLFLAHTHFWFCVVPGLASRHADS